MPRNVLPPVIDPRALIQARLNLGLDQPALVARVQLRCNDFDEKTLRRWESGATRRPRPSKLKCVADALGVPVSALLLHTGATAETAPAPASATPVPAAPQTGTHRDAEPTRDLCFLSYAHADGPAHALVHDALLNELKPRGLTLWDDAQIRAGDRWDDRIQQAMERAAVAVLVLSEAYFQQRQDGDRYLLRKELPYLLQAHADEHVHLLLVYWSPSVHYRSDLPSEPFRYPCGDADRQFDFRSLQRGGQVAPLRFADEQARCLALQQIAYDARIRLEEHLAAAAASPALPPGPGPEPRRPDQPIAHVPGPRAPAAVGPGGLRLDVELTVTPTGLLRVFRCAGNLLRMVDPAPADPDLPAFCDFADPAWGDDAAGLGERLYRILLHDPHGADLFADLARQAWGLTIDTPRTRAVAVELRLRPAAPDPGPAAAWPLRLPWHLTRHRGDTLSTGCGWTFAAIPPGIEPERGSTDFDPEQLWLYLDARLPERAHHASQLATLVRNHWDQAHPVAPCADLDALAERLQGAAPRPPTPPAALYVCAPADLDLARLAALLGADTRLVVLNLIGAPVPAPPPTLVQGRIVLCAPHRQDQAGAAIGAGCRFLGDLLGAPAARDLARLAIDAFGPRLRLWKGLGGLDWRIAARHGDAFHARLVKLLLDRHTARRQISGEINEAFDHPARRVLALVAAGGATDRPDWLMPQAWNEYRRLRGPDSPDDLRVVPLDTGPIAAPDELLQRFASAAFHAGSDTWQDHLDRARDPLAGSARLSLSLEWRLAPCPEPAGSDAAARWRDDWLAAWLDHCAELARYQRPRVLLVSCLIVETSEAAAWTEAAMAAWRPRRAGADGLHHLRMEPLSNVPERDIEDFLEGSYGLYDRVGLDPEPVARWIIEQHGGDFAKTVALVEDLHATVFAAYRLAVAAPPASAVPTEA